MMKLWEFKTKDNYLKWYKTCGGKLKFNFKMVYAKSR